MMQARTDNQISYTSPFVSNAGCESEVIIVFLCLADTNVGNTHFQSLAFWGNSILLVLVVAEMYQAAIEQASRLIKAVVSACR